MQSSIEVSWLVIECDWAWVDTDKTNCTNTLAKASHKKSRIWQAGCYRLQVTSCEIWWPSTKWKAFEFRILLPIASFEQNSKLPSVTKLMKHRKLELPIACCLLPVDLVSFLHYIKCEPSFVKQIIFPVPSHFLLCWQSCRVASWV